MLTSFSMQVGRCESSTRSDIFTAHNPSDDQMNDDRREEAGKVRAVAELASSRPYTQHNAKGDEQMFRQYGKEESEKDNKSHAINLSTFNNGIAEDHDAALIWHPTDVQDLINALNSGDQRGFEEVGSRKN